MNSISGSDLGDSVSGESNINLISFWEIYFKGSNLNKTREFYRALKSEMYNQSKLLKMFPYLPWLMCPPLMWKYP